MTETPELSRSERIVANDCRICPKCGESGKRINTRREVHGVYRRIECTQCRVRWSTLEIDMDRANKILKLEARFAQVWKEIVG